MSSRWRKGASDEYSNDDSGTDGARVLTRSDSTSSELCPIRSHVRTENSARMCRRDGLAGRCALKADAVEGQPCEGREVMTTRSTRPPETEPGTLTTPEGVSERQAVLDAERAKWLTVKEAAHVLGTTPAIVRRLLVSQLPHRREGKIIRIHLDDLRPSPHKEASHADRLATPTAVPRAQESGPSHLLQTRRRFAALQAGGRVRAILGR